MAGTAVSRTFELLGARAGGVLVPPSPPDQSSGSRSKQGAEPGGGMPCTPHVALVVSVLLPLSEGSEAPRGRAGSGRGQRSDLGCRTERKPSLLVRRDLAVVCSAWPTAAPSSRRPYLAPAPGLLKRTTEPAPGGRALHRGHIVKTESAW